MNKPALRRFAARPATIAIFSLALLLSACGGGGGGPGEAEGPVVVNDPGVPRVQSVFPGPNATGVEIDVAPEITFLTEIDPTSITAANLVVRSGSQELGGVVDVLNAGRTLRFTPNLPLPLNAPCEFGFQAGLRDVEGNVRQTPFRSGFSTRDSVALPASPLLPGSDPVGLRGLEIAPDGRGMALYFSNPQGPMRLFAQGIEDGLPTGPPSELFGPADNIRLSRQALAVADGGHATVSFVAEVNGLHSSYATFFDPSTGLWHIEPIEISDTLRTAPPLAAVTTEGRSLVTWLEGPIADTPARVRHARRSAPLGGISIGDLGVATKSEDLGLVMNAAGNGVVTWVDDLGLGGMEVKALPLTLGVPAAVIDIENRQAGAKRSPVAGVDAEGRVAIAWIEVDGLGDEKRVVTVFGGSETTPFSQPRVVDAAEDVSGLQMRSAPAGAGILIWNSEVVTDVRVVASRFEPSVGFASPVPIAGGVGSLAIHIESAIDDNGNAAISIIVSQEFDMEMVMWPGDGTPLAPIPLGRIQQRVPAINFVGEGQAVVGYVVSVVQTDPTAGSFAELRRIRTNGTLGSPIRPRESQLDKFTAALLMRSDERGQTMVLMQDHDVNGTVFSINSMLLR